MIADYYRSGI